MQMDRHAEAEGEIRKALAEDPLDPEALILLAICRMEAQQYAEAVDLAQQAVAQEPDAPFLYLVLGQAHFYSKNIPKARLAIIEGQRLEPTNASFHHLRAQIEFYQENWEQALRETERGLELDPEDVDLVNLRAQALVKLKRNADASATLDYALHKAPENSYSHANKGWVAVENDRYDEAVKHFLEALRLDPGNNYARHGLKEAIKGKNLLYRGVLKYFLWMDKMQENGRWAFIIGMYLAYRLVLYVANAVPWLAPFLYPLIALYVVFALSTWIAKPISNLFLRLHPIGKHALDEDEKMGSNVAGAFAGLAVVAWGISFASGSPLFTNLGIVAMGMLIPAGGAYSVPAGTTARRNLLLYGVVMLGCGLAWSLGGVGGAFAIFALGIFFYSWVANYFISKAAKEFR